MRYFDLSDDVNIPGRWELAEPTDSRGAALDDFWQFTYGHSVSIEGRLKVPVSDAGTPLDFSEAGIRVPVVSGRVASIFAELAPQDVQLMPADIEGQSEPFFILVSTRVVKCIDDERSEEVQYWKPEDGRPERVGHYRSVFRMRIDPRRVGDAKVFRTWGWTVALIVSEDIKEALERMGAVGPKFTEV